MREAIKLSVENVNMGGGPFAAIIVKNNEIIAKAANKVTIKNDPTAHAEVEAIRLASIKLDNFNLSGCEIYTSCEPCPMCLGAIYWARLDKLYFANTKEDAEHAGFDDSFIYKEIERPFSERKLPTQKLLSKEALEAFTDWINKEDKTEY